MIKPNSALFIERSGHLTRCSSSRFAIILTKMKFSKVMQYLEKEEFMKLFNPYFSDHMILQRKQPIQVRGCTEANTIVKATLANQRIETISDGQGNFSFFFDGMEANPSTTLTIATDQEQIEYQDVAIGDVYLAAGQSNMEFRLGDELHFEEVRDHTSDFRFLIVPPVEYFKDGQAFPVFPEAEWKKANRENVKVLSAVAFYALQEIRNYTDVPLGVIGCYKGGTSASSWMNEEILKKQAILKEHFYDRYWQDVLNQSEEEEDQKRFEYNRQVEEYEAKVEQYQKQFPERTLSDLKHELGHTPWPGPKGKKDFGRPGGLYETMFSTIKDFSFKALWWYQGEEDAKSAEHYEVLLSAFIDHWRDELHQDLPIFIVQLPNYIDEKYPETWPIIRQAQIDMYNGKKEIYVLCTLDCGDDYNIHPIEKKKIGDRLGKQVVQVFYDPKCTLPYPYLKEWHREGTSVELIFQNIEEGQIVLEVDGFKRIYPIIEGSTLVPKAKLTISYAYQNNPKELTFENELPMYPFYLQIS